MWRDLLPTKHGGVPSIKESSRRAVRRPMIAASPSSTVMTKPPSFHRTRSGFAAHKLRLIFPSRNVYCCYCFCSAAPRNFATSHHCSTSPTRFSNWRHANRPPEGDPSHSDSKPTYRDYQLVASGNVGTVDEFLKGVWRDQSKRFEFSSLSARQH